MSYKARVVQRKCDECIHYAAKQGMWELPMCKHPRVLKFQTTTHGNAIGLHCDTALLMFSTADSGGPVECLEKRH